LLLLLLAATVLLQSGGDDNAATTEDNGDEDDFGTGVMDPDSRTGVLDPVMDPDSRTRVRPRIRVGVTGCSNPTTLLVMIGEEHALSFSSSFFLVVVASP
jgi:hypothetical protein